MKIKILIVLLILFSIGLGSLAVYIPLRQKQVEMKQKLDTTKVRSDSLEQQVQDLQEQVSTQVIEQKQNALEGTKAGTVYFTAQKTRLSATTSQIDIYLKGEAQTTTDAIDLVLTYPASLRIREVRKGTAFASYPRLLDKDNSVTVTGVAMPQGNTFVYGKVNELYTTLVVEKPDTASASLELDANNTQAYLEGAPILDFTQSFKKIDL